MSRPARSGGARSSRKNAVTTGKRSLRAIRRPNTSLIMLPDLIRMLDGVAIEGLAEESGMPARDVVAQLPANMRSFVSANKLVSILEEISGWGDVTVLLRTPEGAIEITTSLPRVEVAQGYFHWLGESKFRGHFQFDQCAGIAFVQRAFMRRPSAFILFFNRKGGIMFKIAVRRNEHHMLAEDQLSAFQNLAKRLGKPLDDEPAKSFAPKAKRRVSKSSKAEDQ